MSELGGTVNTQPSYTMPAHFQIMSSDAGKQLRDYTVLRGLEQALHNINQENQEMTRRAIENRRKVRRAPKTNVLQSKGVHGQESHNATVTN